MFSFFLFRIIGLGVYPIDYRPSRSQEEHSGIVLSQWGNEVVFQREDTEGQLQYFRERRSKAGEDGYNAKYWGNKDIISMVRQDDELKPLVYIGLGDTAYLDTYDGYMFERKLDISSLNKIYGGYAVTPSTRLVTVGIAENMNSQRKRAMMTALDLMNVFQDRYHFTSQIMEYRHRGYHHIRFRKNLLMLEDEILETRVPDDQQGLILTYNDWDFVESFSHEMKVIFLMHELIIGMKASQGEMYRSVLDDTCDANTTLEEDSSYLPGRSRVLTLCHMQEIGKILTN